MAETASGVKEEVGMILGVSSVELSEEYRALSMKHTEVGVASEESRVCWVGGKFGELKDESNLAVEGNTHVIMIGSMSDPEDEAITSSPDFHSFKTEEEAYAALKEAGWYKVDGIQGMMHSMQTGMELFMLPIYDETNEKHVEVFKSDLEQMDDLTLDY